MRKVWSLVAIAALVALALGVSAEAGGNGAVKVGLYVGYYPEPTTGNPRPESEIQNPSDPTKVGDVIFKATGNGMMHVTINLREGQPETTFQVFIVKQDTWGSVSEQGYTLTTNKQGKASLRFARPIPADADDPVFIKAIVRVSRDGPVYVTDRHYIDW
ncbi:MAG: hypothetical protein JSU66_04400 [Deltaproteobacteria bacterium]|nr:MAG: hypothetical protein JSU66_04400 [Deltaproteobacteria bacterium]